MRDKAEAGSRVKRPGLFARFAPVGLLPPAAFAVHELRYMLAFGGDASAELQRTGHSYLHSVVPWLVLLLTLVVGGFLHALGRALGGQRSLPRYAISLSGLWVVCATSLVVIFACQEFLEGLFATGHPAGLAGIFGYGGWWAIPLAMCVGLVLATAFHGALWGLEAVARRCGRRTPRRSRTEAPPRPRRVIRPRLAPLADGCSGRGPPS